MLCFTYLQDFNQDLDVDPGDPQGETKHSRQHDEEHHHKHPHLENTYSHTPEVLHRSHNSAALRSRHHLQHNTSSTRLHVVFSQINIQEMSTLLYLYILHFLDMFHLKDETFSRTLSPDSVTQFSSGQKHLNELCDATVTSEFHCVHYFG